MMRLGGCTCGSKGAGLCELEARECGGQWYWSPVLSHVQSDGSCPPPGWREEQEGVKDGEGLGRQLQSSAVGENVS